MCHYRRVMIAIACLVVATVSSSGQIAAGQGPGKVVPLEKTNRRLRDELERREKKKNDYIAQAAERGMSNMSG
jgi:hypothetical protein